MCGGEGGFSSMSTIIVGNITWKEGFSTSYFCDGWPTSKTIYGSSNEIASSWKKGGISDWTAATIPG